MCVQVGVAACAALSLMPAAASAGVDWTTYGFGPTRAAFNPAEHVLGPGNVHELHERWSTSVGSSMNTQPALATRVALPGDRTADVVYVGTDKGRFLAVDAASGDVIWQRELGHTHSNSCNEGYGVVDTPVVARSRGSVYVVGGAGVAYELDLATGATKHTWTIVTNNEHEHVWGGLNIALGLLYVPVAATCDIPPFRGRVVAIDVSSR